MNETSRRQFIRSCLLFTLSGCSSAFSLTWSGCKPKDTTKTMGDNPGSLRKEGSFDTGRLDTAADYEPAYLQLYRTGELKRRGEELWGILESCELCPRKCGADRLGGERGFCGASSQLEISSYNPHFGEERPLVGKGGSGTIFLTNCGLRCVFCINWEISQGGEGSPRTIDDMADMMLALQKKGCHNINVVTPTHYSPHIVLAVNKAAGKGLHLPLVYNTCGWERAEILKKLDGIVDIYLPDFKYSDPAMAARYSRGADSYPEFTKAALLEMHRQVGVAKPTRDGVMQRGLMIRHLVMPNNVGGTRQVINWIANNLPKHTYVNILSQYRPMYEAFDSPRISRRLKREEYTDALKWAKEAGLTNLDIQGSFWLTL